jgi:hypothetical protein
MNRSLRASSPERRRPSKIEQDVHAAGWTRSAQELAVIDRITLKREGRA